MRLKEEQLILIIANYQRGVYDSKADFLQAIAETNGAAFIDEMPEDNHYLVNEGINDSEYEDSEQPSSDSEDSEHNNIYINIWVIRFSSGLSHPDFLIRTSSWGLSHEDFLIRTGYRAIICYYEFKNDTKS